MLVLRRRRGESILFKVGQPNCHFKVTVTDITSSAVVIGIDAPKSVDIVREELDARNRILKLYKGEFTDD